VRVLRMNEPRLIGAEHRSSSAYARPAFDGLGRRAAAYGRVHLDVTSPMVPVCRFGMLRAHPQPNALSAIKSVFASVGPLSPILWYPEDYANSIAVGNASGPREREVAISELCWSWITPKTGS